MDPPGPDGSRYTQQPHRNLVFGAHGWGPSDHVAYDGKVSRVCRYFRRGFCFHGDRCSYQHPRAPGTPEWARRYSEPHITLLELQLGLTRRGSEPTYLPSVAVGWAGACWGTKPGLEGLASKAEEVGGSSWKYASPSSADGDHSHSQESQAESELAGELMAPLQSLDLEGQQREEDSRDVVCGICMDKVWNKPEAERVFGILPNCTHAHCLGCLRTWRRNQQHFPPDVIKACPQCRVHSSYIIPHKFWVSEAAAKEQLIRSFKARTSQVQCRFFMRGNGRCPFKSDCIYLHQLPAEAPASGLPWPDRAQLASGSEVLGPALFLGAAKPEKDVFFPDCAPTQALWGSELLLDLSFYYDLLQPGSA